MKDLKKVKIHWWEDAYGNNSCHLNEGVKMAVESYVGRVFFRGSSWVAILKDSLEEKVFSNIQKAKKYVEESVNGEPVGEWD